MHVKSAINILKKNPSLIRHILMGKQKDQLKYISQEMDRKKINDKHREEINKFISDMRKNPVVYSDINPSNTDIKLNRLCSIEDWHNYKISKTILELQQVEEHDYIHKKNWEMSENIVNCRIPGLIHRKDWEWAMGLLAMTRMRKLNKQNVAIGIGAGREEVLFYLANKLSHVYATDLYNGKNWKNFAPTDFVTNPKKYSPFPYMEDRLTVSRMDATKLEFPDESFDIAFSFSSIEHFGGENHTGAIKSMKEIERVLKSKGIAVISTEYILNNKEHSEFFNGRTIFSDLINKLEKLKLIEPLDLRVSTNTLNNIINYDSAVYWDRSEDNFEYKKKHPLILVRVNDMIVTSVMLVFQKD